MLNDKLSISGCLYDTALLGAAGLRADVALFTLGSHVALSKTVSSLGGADKVSEIVTANNQLLAQLKLAEPDAESISL